MHQVLASSERFRRYARTGFGIFGRLFVEEFQLCGRGQHHTGLLGLLVGHPSLAHISVIDETLVLGPDFRLGAGLGVIVADVAEGVARTARLSAAVRRRRFDRVLSLDPGLLTVRFRIRITITVDHTDPTVGPFRHYYTFCLVVPYPDHRQIHPVQVFGVQQLFEQSAIDRFVFDTLAEKPGKGRERGARGVRFGRVLRFVFDCGFVTQNRGSVRVTAPVKLREQKI